MLNRLIVCPFRPSLTFCTRMQEKNVVPHLFCIYVTLNLYPFLYLCNFVCSFGLSYFCLPYFHYLFVYSHLMTCSIPGLSVTFYLYRGYRLSSSSWIYQISINVDNSFFSFYCSFISPRTNKMLQLHKSQSM